MKRLRASAVAAAMMLVQPAMAAGDKPLVQPVRPKLVVAISVDQFAADLFDRYRATYTAGLKRLAGGITFTGYQSHAATETCPGHSTILTGRHPAATGIVANNWFDAKTGSSVYCVAVKGTSDPDARGPQNLLVDTYGDWLKKAVPGARSVAISGKDRAAIMMGGHHADAVYWWVDGEGFTTSSYAGPATPAVRAPAQAFDKALFAQWKAHPPMLWPTSVPAACQPLEKPHSFGKLAVSGEVPPTFSKGVETGPDFLQRTDFQDQLRVSPLFDPMTIDFAKQIIDHDQLGRGPATDLLAISLSTTDYIGHRYGNGGAEMCVQMQAVDQAIGALLDKLDSLHVPYIVALTADHGGSDAAERLHETDPEAQRIDGAALVASLNKHLEQVLGIGYEPIVGDDPQQLTINVPGDDSAFRARLTEAAIAWLKQQPQVADVFTAEQVKAAAPAPGKPVTELTIAERFHESYYPGRSGDIQVALKPKATIGMPRGPGDTVAGHGSPWDYDRRVPILFWWPGVTAEPRKDAIETVDIAPTLAGMTGVPTPTVDGQCLASVAGKGCSAR